MSDVGKHTSGVKGGGTALDSSAGQSMELNQTWFRSSSKPSPDLHANRRDGSRSRNCYIVRVTVRWGDYATYTLECQYCCTAAFPICIFGETQMIP